MRAWRAFSLTGEVSAMLNIILLGAGALAGFKGSSQHVLAGVRVAVR